MISSKFTNDADKVLKTIGEEEFNMSTVGYVDMTKRRLLK